MDKHEKIRKFRKTHIGRYLYELYYAFNLISVPYIQKNGFEEFTEGQLNILGHININKATPTQYLIEKLGLSKQAISRMITLCERNGYIERKQSMTDLRSKDIIFSPKGIQLMITAKKATEYAEAEMEKKLGSGSYNILKEKLADACHELDLIKID